VDLETFIKEWQDDRDRVLVHTSGSTGQPKPLWVEKRRMAASARKTCSFLGLQSGDTALLCMSLDYIAGKMMVVRALTCGLRLLTVAPQRHPLAAVPDGPLDFVAMVPLQVKASLEVPAERARLMAVKHLLIGGGAVDEQLAAQLKVFPHAVWSSYGMTETLSHIALRRLNGPAASDWYTPLPGVSVGLADDGCLTIDAPDVCDAALKTNDLGEMHDGLFRILGRKDNVVCSGGLKLQMEAIEAALRPYCDRPFMITKCPDDRLGEAVVLLAATPPTDDWRRLCEARLPRYWRPRHYCYVAALPTTETGKPARKQAEEMVSLLLRRP